MVDIVGLAHAVCKVEQICNRSKNIVYDNVIRNKVITAKFNFSLKSLLIVADLFHNFAKYTVGNLFVYAECFFVNIYIAVNVNHSVAENLNNLAGFKLDICRHNT